MKKHFIRLLAFICLAGASSSCKKDDGNFGPLDQNIAAIPVTVPNQAFFEYFPIVTTSLADGGKIIIQMRIPPNKGQIKEITRVGLGNFGRINVQSGNPSYLFNYSTTSKTIIPIAGNGSNEITFSTTTAEYTAYSNRVPANQFVGPAAIPSTDPENPTQLRFFFLITLEDGTQIVPTQIRVRILP